jgi:colanic acid/amylovoran biosynthesis glycosyltransferase
MKINLVYNSFPSPSETFLFNLAVELAKRNHEIRVVILNSSDNKKHYNDRLIDWKSQTVQFPEKNPISWLLYVLLRLGKFLKFARNKRILSVKETLVSFVKLEIISENKPEIIHFAYTSTAIEFINILDLASEKSKIFVSARGTSEILKPLVDQHRAQLLTMLWDKVDVVHCVSIDIMKRLEKSGLKSDKCFINYPSIDISNFPFIYRKSEVIQSIKTNVIIVSTGRLNFQKGYIFALIAISHLIKKGIKVKYHILGDGPEREMLKFLATDLEISENIIFHGKVTSQDLKVVLENAHIFLLPSIYEGVSNAVLEAMASGIPVITTNAGGMAEVVRNNYNGYLIDRYDPFAISEQLENIIDNYDTALSMTHQARNTVTDKFNLENQIDVFEANYNKK